MTGGGFRVIEGGRSDEPTPGILIVGAAEVVTLEGGVRAGERQGDVARYPAADVGGPASADAPVVACWEGRIAAVGPRSVVEVLGQVTRSAGSRASAGGTVTLG
jgi:hypothetical protein